MHLLFFQKYSATVKRERNVQPFKTFAPGDRPYKKAHYENDIFKIAAAKNNRHQKAAGFIEIK